MLGKKLIAHVPVGGGGHGRGREGGRGKGGRGRRDGGEGEGGEEDTMTEGRSDGSERTSDVDESGADHCWMWCSSARALQGGGVAASPAGLSLLLAIGSAGASSTALAVHRPSVVLCEASQLSSAGRVGVRDGRLELSRGGGTVAEGKSPLCPRRRCLVSEGGQRCRRPARWLFAHRPCWAVHATRET